MIGHAMPAAGIAGLIKAALAVHHGVLPPTLHCDDPHPALAGTRFVPVTAARPWDGAEPRRAGVNAFGFGGINAHVVLEEPPGARSVRRRPSRAPVEELLLLAGPHRPPTSLRQLDTRRRARRTARAGWRSINPDAKRLALARRVVEQGKPWRGRNDLWFTPTPLLGEHAESPGTVAFVFPGLEQSFEPRVDDVAGALRTLVPSTWACRASSATSGSAWSASGRVLDAALRRLGIAPDLVAGHSVGEWSAMIAAELYPRDAVRGVHRRLRPGRAGGARASSSRRSAAAPSRPAAPSPGSTTWWSRTTTARTSRSSAASRARC